MVKEFEFKNKKNEKNQTNLLGPYLAKSSSAASLVFPLLTSVLKRLHSSSKVIMWLSTTISFLSSLRSGKVWLQLNTWSSDSYNDPFCLFKSK